MKPPSPLERDQLRAVMPGDRRSLVALAAALGARGDYQYVHVGHDSIGILEYLIEDPHCARAIVVADQQLTERARATVEANGELGFVASRAEQRLSKEPPDLCVIEHDGGEDGILRLVRSCREAMGDRGVIVLPRRTELRGGLVRLLSDLPGARAYPLAHDLLVVELNVPTLSSDPRVQAQLPRTVWRLAHHFGLVPLALRVGPIVGWLEGLLARAILTLSAPRRARRAAPLHSMRTGPPFEIHTFVNDDALYDQMRESFIQAGFSPSCFVPLSDHGDDPYAAIGRIGEASDARYPILCHQDVRADRGAGARELLAALEQLDTADPHWVVAGNAGLMRTGRMLRRLIDPDGGFSGASPPLSVVSLDENFLAFNCRNPVRRSEGLSGFHLYGTDACLHALASGGSAYVVDFPVTHLSCGDAEGDDYARVKERFVKTWNRRYLFRFVVTPTAALFLSSSSILRAVFGSSPVLHWLENALVPPSIRPS